MSSRPALHRALLLALVSLSLGLCRQTSAQSSRADHDYKNPILFADYSDPDVIRDGKDFYLVASTFHFVPGIPVLQSRDLVHWRIVAHVVARMNMSPAYDMVGGYRYGGGVWAPAVRFHNGLFYVYFPTPDEGIFVSTAPHMTGPWTEPVAVLPGPGLEDPCPFWDDDGQAYLVHSRKGAGPLILHRMSADGKHLLDDGRVIVQDPVHLKTLEGPKLYKRNGWYYIFAPMGGVSTGDQVVLRSRNIDGPYEVRHVLTQGTTTVNGPHQGGWVETPDGHSYFIHFQQRGAHGRIVWLEPMSWKDDWPTMGTTPPGAQVSQPVLSAPMPVLDRTDLTWHPQTSDDFSSATLSPMWEWNHNPDNTRWSLTERKGFLRLHPSAADQLLHARNTLTETMQDQSLQVTTSLDLTHMTDGDNAGLSVFDRSTSDIGVVQSGSARHLFTSLKDEQTPGPAVPTGLDVLQLRAEVLGDTATYFYSLDQGKTFLPLGTPVKLAFSWWKGARPALFAYNTLGPSKGFIDFDWLHYTRLPDTAPTQAKAEPQH